LQTVIHLLLLSLIELFNLLGVLLAVGFVLGYLEKWSTQFLLRAFGWKGIAATAWLGTPVHELSHVLMCIVFGHRITEIKWLQLYSGDGVLGYVSHEYNPGSLYQRIGNFFIGTAPVILGILTLVAGMYVLLPDTYAPFMDTVHMQIQTGAAQKHILILLGSSFSALAANLFTIDNFVNPRFWIYVLLAICISSHSALSTADLKGAYSGCLSIFGLLVFLNVMAVLFGFNISELIAKLAGYNFYILAFSSIAIFFSLVTLLIGYTAAKLKRY
jgi:hypothetical protein